MRTAPHMLFRGCAIAACAVVVASGCRLDRSIPARIGIVSPTQYCPGDTVRASFDFLGSDTCTPIGAMTCESQMPVMTLSSAPTSFPTQAIRGYLGQVDFMPTEAVVDVTFDIDRERVLIPATPIPLERAQLRDQTTRITRIDGTIPETLNIIGTCEGGGTFLEAALDEQRLSPRLRIEQVRNTSGVAVNVVPLDASGMAGVPQTLPPGASAPLDAPGAPARQWRRLRVTPAMPLPVGTCPSDPTHVPDGPPLPQLSVIALSSCA